MIHILLQNLKHPRRRRMPFLPCTHRRTPNPHPIPVHHRLLPRNAHKHQHRPSRRTLRMPRVLLRPHPRINRRHHRPHRRHPSPSPTTAQYHPTHPSQHHSPHHTPHSRLQFIRFFHPAAIPHLPHHRHRNLKSQIPIPVPRSQISNLKSQILKAEKSPGVARTTRSMLPIP